MQGRSRRLNPRCKQPQRVLAMDCSKCSRLPDKVVSTGSGGRTVACGGHVNRCVERPFNRIDRQSIHERWFDALALRIMALIFVYLGSFRTAHRSNDAHYDAVLRNVSCQFELPTCGTSQRPCLLTKEHSAPRTRRRGTRGLTRGLQIPGAERCTGGLQAETVAPVP